MSAWCMLCGDSATARFAGQRIVSSHLADNTLLQNYTTVLEIIMRLRMICDHADLVTQDAPQSAAEASHPSSCQPPRARPATDQRSQGARYLGEACKELR